MITISGLNQRQAEMCDRIWNCQTIDDVDNFINSMPTPSLRKEARMMQHLILAAVFDNEVQTADDCYQARQILSKFG